MKNKVQIDQLHNEGAALITELRAERGALRDILRRLLLECGSLFRAADDAVVNTGDGWACNSCGMELDTGGGHKDSCIAAKIFDLRVLLQEAEEVLAGKPLL